MTTCVHACFQLYVSCIVICTTAWHVSYISTTFLLITLFSMIWGHVFLTWHWCLITRWTWRSFSICKVVTFCGIICCAVILFLLCCYQSSCGRNQIAINAQSWKLLAVSTPYLKILKDAFWGWGVGSGGWGWGGVGWLVKLSNTSSAHYSYSWPSHIQHQYLQTQPHPDLITELHPITKNIW